MCRETPEQREESAGVAGSPAVLASVDQASLQAAAESPLADTTSSGPSSGQFTFDTDTVASIDLAGASFDSEFPEWF